MKYDLRSLDPETLETAAEVRAAMEQCQAALDSVKQLLEAAVRYNATGVRSDPRWYTAAVAARGMYGRLHQRLTARLGRLNRAEKAVAHDAQRKVFDTLFREVVAEHVGNETLATWLTETRERMKREGVPC